MATRILIEKAFAIKVHYFRKLSCYYVPVCRHLQTLVTNAAIIGTVSLALLATTVSVTRNCYSFEAARSPVDRDWLVESCCCIGRKPLQSLASLRVRTKSLSSAL